MHSAMFDSARVRGVKTPRMRWAVNQTAGNSFLLVTLGAKKKRLDWDSEVVWANSEVRERDNKEEQECCCLSSSWSGDESVSSASESDDRPHLSPEHCHLLPAVITRLLRRCSPQHLREGTSWRWPLHKFESCSRAWIHVDTLKITAKGQGKDSSASQSQRERTSRYPFVEWSKEKNRTLMAPVIARSTRRSV